MPSPGHWTFAEVIPRGWSPLCTCQNDPHGETLFFSPINETVKGKEHAAPSTQPGLFLLIGFKMGNSCPILFQTAVSASSGTVLEPCTERKKRAVGYGKQAEAWPEEPSPMNISRRTSTVRRWFKFQPYSVHVPRNIEAPWMPEVPQDHRKVLWMGFQGAVSL